MSAPTEIERAHYAKFVGRQITAIQWAEIEGLALPVLVLSGWDRDGNVASATVLMDPEGNGPVIWITICDPQLTAGGGQTVPSGLASPITKNIKSNNERRRTWD
jgi:hypothetical protein